MGDVLFIAGWLFIVVLPASIAAYRIVGDRLLFGRMTRPYAAGIVLFVAAFLERNEPWGGYIASLGALLVGASMVFFSEPWAHVYTRFFGWMWTPYQNTALMRVVVILGGGAFWVWAVALLADQP